MPTTSLSVELWVTNFCLVEVLHTEPFRVTWFRLCVLSYLNERQMQHRPTIEYNRMCLHPALKLNQRGLQILDDATQLSVIINSRAL